MFYIRFLLLIKLFSYIFAFFFFNHPATAEIYTLSLHDALPILVDTLGGLEVLGIPEEDVGDVGPFVCFWSARSEEHTSELQSHHDLVCRLLLEKKKTTIVACCSR